MTLVGFVGLGNMGGPMSANLARAGHDLLTFDIVDAATRAPVGARVAASVAEVAAQAEPIFLSLPDGAASLAVCRDVANAPGRNVRAVVDLSTIGIEAAREAAALLATAGVTYIDAPVSGGVGGARSATLAAMISGDTEAIARIDPLLAPMAANRFVVGSEPGQGQAMKLLNNFLSSTALAATSEAIRFGERRGLDLATMLDVLNASSGRNSATADKYPRGVLTGTFDLGFTARLMAKDVTLYRAAAEESGAPTAIAEAVAALWQAMASAMPSADFSRMYDFVEQEPGVIPPAG